MIWREDKVGEFKRMYDKNGYKQYLFNKENGGCLYQEGYLLQRK